MADFMNTSARRWRRAVIDAIVLAAFAAICVGMLMTVGDVLARLAARTVEALSGTRPKWGLFGLVDLTQLTMMVAAPLAIAAAVFWDAHIRVDILTSTAPDRAKRWSLRLSALVGMSVTGLCVWTAWNEMRGQLDFTTTSSTLGIAYTWYWVPLIIGLALAFCGCLLAFVVPSLQGDHDA
jgi:TRAP-type C4-dicarboxylate transport system permease small subunit